VHLGCNTFAHGVVKPCRSVGFVHPQFVGVDVEQIVAGVFHLDPAHVFRETPLFQAVGLRDEVMGIGVFAGDHVAIF
jgi:hypothetical protein